MCPLSSSCIADLHLLGGSSERRETTQLEKTASRDFGADECGFRHHQYAIGKLITGSAEKEMGGGWRHQSHGGNIGVHQSRTTIAQGRIRFRVGEPFTSVELSRHEGLINYVFFYTGPGGVID